MNAAEYCHMVEERDVLIKQLITTMPVADDNSPLVSLKDFAFNLQYEPSVMHDYQYLVREAIVEKIGRISVSLEKQDKVLIIRSAWRSFYHQQLLWDNKKKFEKIQHPEIGEHELNELISYFIAPPKKSMHATGGAVDALIFDLTKNRVMDFGTNDGLNIDLNKQCYPNHPAISKEAALNRALLISLFEEEGFVVDVKEYWHFDYGNVIWAIEKKKEHAIYGVVNE